MRMQVKENYQREQNLWEGMNTELFQTTSKALSRRQIDVKIYNKETENILNSQHSPAESL